MLIRIALVLFSIAGISASFMPWLYFPKVDTSFYGYKADGVVTGFVFLLILIYAIYTLKIRKFTPKLSVVVALLGLWMAYLSYSKIVSVEEQKLNFNPDNALLASAVAGTTQGIGLYVFGASGICVFLTVFLGLWLQYYTSKPVQKEEKKLFYKIALPLMAVLMASIAYLYFFNSSLKTDKESLQQVFKEDIKNMGIALTTADYEKFADYNHLMMVQSLGGREKFIQLTKSTMENLKAAGTEISDIELGEILEIAKNGRNVQAIITQKVKFSDNTQKAEETHKVLAVSENSGKSWHYINITGKTKSEMQKFYPSLIQELNF